MPTWLWGPKKSLLQSKRSRSGYIKTFFNKVVKLSVVVENGATQDTF